MDHGETLFQDMIQDTAIVLLKYICKNRVDNIVIYTNNKVITTNMLLYA